jgi:hypothetical protein
LPRQRLVCRSWLLLPKGVGDDDHHICYLRERGSYRRIESGFKGVCKYRFFYSEEVQNTGGS